METSYFRKLEEQDRLLARHGLDHWPSEEELICYLFDIEDKIDSFCEAMGFTVVRDYRGRWRVCRAHRRTNGGDHRGF